jgi:peptidoglycan/xylan/chitin deacetylase (PgdA/CDA1 family)
MRRAGVISVVATSIAVSLHAQPERQIALTFDDLPANTMRGPDVYDGILNRLIDRLYDAQVPAYGFVNEGKLYEANRPDRARVKLLARWLDAGFELGNHGYQHLDLHNTPLTTYLDDIDRGGEVTSDLLYQRGAELEYYRHPMLHTGTSLAIRDSVNVHLADRGMRVAPVTIDNQEWIFARAYETALVCTDDEAARQIADSYLTYMDTVTGYYEAQSRAIIGYVIPQVLLLHANQLNAEYLEPLLNVYRKRGYRFISLDDALDDPAYARPDTYTGTGGITWLHRWALTDGKQGSFFAGEPGVPGLVEDWYGAECK